MTRAIEQRFEISGQLVAETPISVAGLEGASTADMVLAVNGRGDYYLPGTSLAGPMRAWCLDVLGEEPTRALWGRIPPRNSRAKGHASYVWVEDAVVWNTAAPEIRDGVGIDRHTGTAAPGFKFDRQVLPKGTRFDFAMTVEQPVADELLAGVSAGDIAQAIKGMAQLLAAMQKGCVRFGGAKTRGLGKLRLEGLCVERHEPSTRKGVLARLTGRALEQGGLEQLDPDDMENNPGCSGLTISIKWHADGPVMVKSGDEGLTVDMLPLLSADGKGRLVQVLTGAGIKGALRTMSQRICATLWPEDPPPPDDFLVQLDRHPLVQLLYGARKNNMAASGDGKSSSAPGLAALSADDCYATHPSVSARKWRQLMSVERGDQKSKAAFGPTVERLKQEKLAGNLRPTAHVAIDRWTGGAAEGALYSVLEPINTEWGDITLSLNLKRLLAAVPEDGKPAKTQARAAVALLALTLRELARGTIPLGFAGNRGMGTVVVEKITFKLTGSLPEDLADLACLDSLELTPDCFADTGRLRALAALEDAWQAYQRAMEGQA